MSPPISIPATTARAAGGIESKGTLETELTSLNTHFRTRFSSTAIAQLYLRTLAKINCPF